MFTTIICYKFTQFGIFIKVYINLKNSKIRDFQSCIIIQENKCNYCKMSILPLPNNPTKWVFCNNSQGSLFLFQFVRFLSPIPLVPNCFFIFLIWFNYFCKNNLLITFHAIIFERKAGKKRVFKFSYITNGVGFIIKEGGRLCFIYENATLKLYHILFLSNIQSSILFACQISFYFIKFFMLINWEFSPLIIKIFLLIYCFLIWNYTTT